MKKLKSNTDRKVNKAKRRVVVDLKKMGIKVPKGMRHIPWFLFPQNE